jgi:hypothetical protein
MNVSVSADADEEASRVAVGVTRSAETETLRWRGL